MKSSSSSSPFNGGSLRELFRFAAAVLMDYDKEKTVRFLRVGEFVINLITQMTFNTGCLLMCVCVLGELQWPLARDAPVFRVGLRTFVFAMPGLLYGIQFPPTCSTDVMDTLERVFLKFGYYKDVNESGVGFQLQDNEPHFWQRIYTRIESLAQITISRLGHIPGRRSSLITANSTAGFHNLGLLRVLRMSATTKMVSRVILSGSVKAVHINIKNPKSVNRKHNENDDDQPTYYASIYVFTDLVDAVEIAWTVASLDSSDRDDHHLLEKNPNMVLVDQTLKELKAWRWTKKGIVDFMKEMISADDVIKDGRHEKNQ